MGWLKTKFNISYYYYDGSVNITAYIYNSLEEAEHYASIQMQKESHLIKRYKINYEN